MRWTDITPQAAAEQNIDCQERPDLDPPHNEMGEVCPWPWDPQQRDGQPVGQYHCPYCLAMVIAGMEHLDYGPEGMEGVTRPDDQEGLAGQ